MLKFCEVKADATGQTWGTILALVWKPQKNLIVPNEARHATVSARSESHVWYKSQRKCTKYPQKSSYL